MMSEKVDSGREKESESGKFVDQLFGDLNERWDRVRLEAIRKGDTESRGRAIRRQEFCARIPGFLHERARRISLDQDKIKAITDTIDLQGNRSSDLDMIFIMTLATMINSWE